MDKFVALGSALLVMALITLGIKNGAIPISKDPFAIYQQSDSNEKHFKADFLFENKSNLIGSSVVDLRENFALYVAVGDIDNDGYEDVVMVNHNIKMGNSLKVLKNIGGKFFEDQTQKVLNLSEVSTTAFSASVLVDLDNDGWPDLYIAQFMKSHLALKNIKGHFDYKHQIAIDQIIAPTRGINLVDFNKDGFVDFYLTSFSESVYSSLFDNPHAVSEAPYPIRSLSGSQNILLLNEYGKKLTKTKDALGLSDGGYTWAVGIADFKNTGYPDFYIANDFGYDRFYKNIDGKKFVDVSQSALGDIRSENAMGVEIADIHNNNRLGIYVSNASKPGMPRGWNHFWQMNDDVKLSFSDMSTDLQIDKCGFSWGAKFADLDKDGHLDLFVVNGRSGQLNEKTQNRWIYRLYEWNIPPELKYLKYIQVPQVNYHFAQGQRNCVFVQRDEKFIDISQSVGVSDEENGRALAVMDLDNDGQEDFLISNLLFDPILYKGTRFNKNQWLGLKLVGIRSNRDAIGAKVKMITEQSTQTRLIFPTNGYQNESSRRVIFGVKETDHVKKIQIFWPSGAQQDFYPEELNRYYEITEKF